jgi:lipopolysaccharide biosynthesis glycosyltransferase
MPTPAATECVQVAVTSDRNYVMPLAAMLASLHAALDTRRLLVVHVLGSGFCPETWRSLREALPEERIRWNPIDVPDSVPGDDYRTRGWEHISAVCYYRLLLPELLPAKLEKVLYLDGDLIIRADIGELWDTDLGDFALAAVAERDRRAHTVASPGGIRLYRELGLEAEQRQFNTGVLLVNLPLWRRYRLAERAFDYIRQSGADLRWYEQEALNVVTRGEFRALEPRWNCAVGVDSPAEIEAASILHYLSAHKPWHWDYDPALAAPFFEALERTPWRGWRPERPRQATLRRLGARARKAVKKRLHGCESARRMCAARLRYRLARPAPVRRQGSSPPPAAGGREIRLFLPVPDEVESPPLLDAWFEAGIDRAFVLARGDKVSAVPEVPEGRAALVHFFTAPDAQADVALRRLLQRYGQSHWCVLGRPWEMMVDEEGSLLDLARFCAGLEASGLEVQEAAAHEGEEVRLTARDLRTNRIFAATARAARPERSWEPTPLTSRVVAVRYSGRILLDRGMRLCGNARKNGRLLRLRRMSPTES